MAAASLPAAQLMLLNGLGPFLNGNNLINSNGNNSPASANPLAAAAAAAAAAAVSNQSNNGSNNLMFNLAPNSSSLSNG